ncbi:cation transporter [Paeniglutamicibacter antarcticus]|uniref:Cation transporter n=1 Tax=Arthrobacter terrae TaxID=2935737 RepID=A0A931G5T4_9MICC|nr:cation transporter [Arthrobacter terrae]MBG0741206.1 cation transporter [Arthrobacter terrae]
MLTILIAFGANFLVAVAKSVAAALTGSASMTAEAAHSWADTGNEVFLIIADKRSKKKGDPAHPYGYGREAYVWAMLAACGLFTAGAAVSIMHGVQQLFTPEPASDFLIAYIVLAVSFVLEGMSFLQALRQARKLAARHKRGVLEDVMLGSDPTLRAVFAEDSAALVGLAIAFAGIFLHQVTGSAVPDALGSILVGLLLAVVAVVLIDRNRRFLVGQAVTPELEQSALRMLLEHRDIERVTYIHLEFVGPNRLYLVAAVDMAGNCPESDVALALRRVEREVEANDLIEEAVLTLATNEETSLEEDAL